MSKLAIIPARGGSKRIPRKNIKDFLGKPIIAYSIETALQSGLFDEVMVSTDDCEIAKVAKKYGAKVPFYRSSETSDDFATTVSVIKEVLYNYESKFHQKFDYVCCIYPTAPLIQVKHLIQGFELLINKNFISVFPVVDFGYPIWRGLFITEGNMIDLIWPKHINSRSQDLEKVYHDAGQWYWVNHKYLTDYLFTKNSGAIFISENQAQDIDSATDWILAEMKYKLINFSNKNEQI